ncbi:UDP-4-amino-4,6-dideoxy-N-acetyl-beta-L-altrosamine transaminase [Psychromonas antarctica]|uniref:UDP-4-amino-4, 6-dideoxy-N-acetyl-beta-L-altrosamine transaminase n=1 Tax=Psychromonas antarctica TaxID=67573 RepID=UPI001EE9245F|nr:UDP-4-amino-4,6-dideoxy-N-acetyl-beta-L-altrosamine transaminase [Psychromonas antarctica]MCG6202439.1 UDP-4-amino-4,6-dideoxy-N-acetyl-beta-L-altrosamine transaminase [Psychromonas antarctica]
MIPYGKQEINQQDIDAVIKVLQSDFLTQGPQVVLFEQALSIRCNAQYSVAVNSATSALHIACLALGVGKGDIVWTTPNTFVASANCALYCGASIDFVDIDADTYNLCPIQLEQKLIKAKKDNCLPKVVIPVHLAGQSCAMQEIHQLSLEYGFSIIEDASHAIGGYYRNQPIGNCLYSDITVFSFHPVKIITTAEGGVATTNNPTLASKMNLFRSHGITRDEKLMTEPSHGAWYYQQIDLGFNYRMTDLQAALGISQLQRLDEFVARRQQRAEYYNKALADLPLFLPKQLTETKSSWHLYIIQLDLHKIASSHQQIFNALREAGIGVNLHYIPVHMQPYYQALGFHLGNFPNSESYYSQAISIPLYPMLSQVEQNHIIDTLKKVLL